MSRMQDFEMKFRKAILPQFGAAFKGHHGRSSYQTTAEKIGRRRDHLAASRVSRPVRRTGANDLVGGQKTTGICEGKRKAEELQVYRREFSGRTARRLALEMKVAAKATWVVRNSFVLWMLQTACF